MFPEIFCILSHILQSMTKSVDCLGYNYASSYHKNNYDVFLESEWLGL